MAERALEILLVEDNPNDVLIARRALSRSTLTFHLVVARDGHDALNFLYQGHPADSDPPLRPDLILLDLNLPRVDGFEVLRIVKSERQLRTIPVIILTTSEREEDIARSYALGANTYFSKPVEYDRFQEIIQLLSSYWGAAAKLPPKDTGLAG